MNPPTIFIISRADLPTGLRDAQECHAAYSLGRATLAGHAFPFCICLRARDEAHLRDLYALAQGRSLPCHLIEEPDMGYAATALGIGPIPRSEGRFLSSLPTIKENSARVAQSRAPKGA